MDNTYREMSPQYDNVHGQMGSVLKTLAHSPAFAYIAPPLITRNEGIMAATSAKKQEKNTRPTLPKGYTPSEKEEYMNDQQVEYFRQKLEAWRDELLKESNETLDHLREENWNEPDITDRATVESETALELRTRDRYRKLINKIDQGLLRIERGEYGYCEETGDPIGIKRLEARPIATLSIAAQERHERDEKQHIDS